MQTWTQRNVLHVLLQAPTFASQVVAQSMQISLHEITQRRQSAAAPEAIAHENFHLRHKVFAGIAPNLSWAY